MSTYSQYVQWFSKDMRMCFPHWTQQPPPEPPYDYTPGAPWNPPEPGPNVKLDHIVAILERIEALLKKEATVTEPDLASLGEE